MSEYTEKTVAELRKEIIKLCTSSCLSINQILNSLDLAKSIIMNTTITSFEGEEPGQSKERKPAEDEGTL